MENGHVATVLIPTAPGSVMSTVTIVSRDALEDERLVPDGGEGVLLGFRLVRLFLNVGGGVDVRGEGPEDGLGHRGMLRAAKTLRKMVVGR